MALGGGTFLVHNKELPGTYINFVSVPRATNVFGDRGRVALALDLDWGSDQLMVVDSADFMKESLALFGYEATHPALAKVREALLHAKEAYVYRLNVGGEKATLTNEGLTVTAQWPGVRGNALSVVVEKDIFQDGVYIVQTLMDGKKVDEQTVAKMDELRPSAFVVFSGKGELQAMVETNLAGGANGQTQADAHSAFLEALETVHVNAIACASEDESVKRLYVAFVKRLRDDEGVKTQVVLYDYAADYEGVINVTTPGVEGKALLTYWVAGATAGANVNEGLDNRRYDGEFTITKPYKQRDLKEAIAKGEFIFHTVNQEPVVLMDLNSFVSVNPNKNRDFTKNQIIRLVDQIAMDCATIFNRQYLGKVQNNEDGRIALWNDLVNHAKTLVKIGAIQNFDAADITVVQGAEKDEVDVEYLVTPVLTMLKLYMIVRVR